jgi:hypothetical protein
MNARGIIACRKYPVVYLNLPKCACTTIKNILFYLDMGKPLANALGIHKSIRSGSVLINFNSPVELKHSIINRNISFTFVRHPLSRAYSCFNEKVYHQSPYSFRGLRNSFLNQKYKLIFPEKNAIYSIEQHSGNFEKFLFFIRDNMAGKTQYRKDAHWLPQTQLLNKFQKYTAIDYIGRVERFREGIRYVLNSIGVNDSEYLSQIKCNEGDPPPFSYKEILNDRILKLGHEIYESDFVKLGYDHI